MIQSFFSSRMQGVLIFLVLLIVCVDTKAGGESKPGTAAWVPAWIRTLEQLKEFACDNVVAREQLYSHIVPVSRDVSFAYNEATAADKHAFSLVISLSLETVDGLVMKCGDEYRWNKLTDTLQKTEKYIRNAS